MSQAGANSGSNSPSGDVNSLTPDVGASVVPTAGAIALTGQPTGSGSNVPEDNFYTYNAGTSAMQIAHRYQDSGTTTDGVTPVTLLTIPITVASCINISAQLAGIEATPTGVGGEIRGTVFKGGAGTGVLLGTPDKVVRASAALAAATFDVAVDGGGNNLLLTVTGVAGKTIEWYVIAEIVVKSFI